MSPRLLLAFWGLIATCIAYGKPSIVVGETAFLLANEEMHGGDRLREFLPSGDSFERWTRLVGVREYPKLHDSRVYIGNMSQRYHAKFPLMHYQVAQDVSTSDWMFDFMEYPTSGSLNFLEWNFFRAHETAHGLIVYQYAERFYFQDDATEAGKMFKETRQKMLGTLWSAKFEEKEEPDQPTGPMLSPGTSSEGPESHHP
jgi:hypothetical protein